MGRKTETVTKTFQAFGGGETIVHTVELFPWEKLDKVDELKQVFKL